MESLVSTEWLADEMAACDLRIVDASAHLPAAERNAREEYLAGHIPGALFIDLANLIDTSCPTENALPPPEMFASRMARLGIGDGSRIVIYDDSDIKSATRAWFLFKLFGAQSVAILDGGLKKWKAEGRPLEAGESTRRERHYTAWSNPGRLRVKQDVLVNIARCDEQLVDARSAARWSGAEPDPRPHIASGSIPGSVNVPYASLYHPDGTMRPRDELLAAFRGAGVDLERPVIASCGSGMTACALIFALHLLGKDDVALYDGSWTEWGADPDTPKAVQA